MFPVQRIKGTSGAETLGLFAVLGALATPVLALQQVSSEGTAVLEHAAWWLRFGLAEVFFVLVLVAAWRLLRRSRA
jgi:hypothetical protein